ncbi:MAG: EcsC family protein [Firmicutes bacterium]|nr:EcsC family protein [Bacillota bacterium]
MVIFNPFDHINKNDIRKRVEKLRRKNPDLTREELCRLIVKKKSRWCAAAGAVTALPGAVPVLGTLVAIVGGTALDMTAMGFFVTEMILEVAAVYNRKLDIQGTSREAVWVLMSSVGAGMAGRGLTKVTVAQLSGRAFMRLIEQALLAMGIRATQRTVLRIIPFIGTVIAGAVNYYTCKKVGEFVIKHYASNSYDDAWDGITIDTESEVNKEIN